jgi:putative resolvase
MTVSNYIRLSQWAAQHGMHRMTAWRHYNAGTLPPELQPKKIGNIIYVLANPDAPSGRMVGYARVSSAEQKPHLENQANRLWAYAGQNHIPLDDVVSEIASGLNDRRPKLLKLLGDPTVHTVIIEHRERLARFGVGMVEAMLQARGGSLIVIDGAEVSDDLVRDMTEILTCFCARLYGKRSAADKARRAMEAASG